VNQPDEYRAKVAVVQPVMIPGGGTESVTAWTVQCLKKNYDVTLVSFSQVDIDTLNRYYGTDLREGEVSIIRPSLPPGLNRTRRLSLLKDHLMMRYCKSIAKNFDLFIASSAMDFGSPGIQFIQMGPDSNFVQVLQGDPSISKGYLFVKRSFVRACKLVSGYSEQAVRKNIYLANSKATGLMLEQVFSNHDYKVVYPPVTSVPAVIPWEHREEGFLCISRIEPYKQQERIIQILKRVREQGFEVQLKIIGRVDDKNYYGIISRLRDENLPWITMDQDVPREQLFRLMNSYKYGINGALDEHFGIAVAEMMKAGCIVFVPHRGGQTEIINTPELIYKDVDDAVDKITRVLRGEVSQDELRNHLDRQGTLFSNQAFCQTMGTIVDDFFEPLQHTDSMNV